MIEVARRSVRELDHSPSLGNQSIQGEVQWFCEQELRHAGAHLKAMEVLEKQGAMGPELSGQIEAVGVWLLKWVPLSWNLAISAAIENVTAALAILILRDRVLDAVPEPMLGLLKWHCEEEWEHRHVIFDLMQIYTRRSYAARATGWFLSFAVLGVLGFWATAHCLQVRTKNRLPRYSEMRSLFGLFVSEEGVLYKSIPYLMRYLQPAFHPLSSHELPDHPRVKKTA